MKKKRILSAALALLLMASLPVTAFAADWYLEDGDITVSADNSGQTVSQGGSVAVTDAAPVITQRDSTAATANTVTITAAEKQTANITLKDVNIDVSGTGSYAAAGSAAVSAEGKGSVTIELDGENTVRSGYLRAGVEKNNDGSLTITAADDNGSLDAHGGQYGAGIGGGNYGSGSSITISGGEVTAEGGYGGAGIGGGFKGSGSNITVSSGEVKAQGGNGGAGIGGGNDGSGSSITVSGGEVTANGGYGGAGIGSGWGFANQGSDITISGGEVNATGGKLGAGIGGGHGGRGSNITLSGGMTKAVSGNAGAGIGGGNDGSGSNITLSGNAQAKVQGGVKTGPYGEGAPIGNGGSYYEEEGTAYITPIDGAEVEPDVSELTAEGKIEYYASDADMKTAKPTKIIHGGEHEWDEGAVTKEPTCTEKGVMTYTCKFGDKVTKTEDISTLPHTVVTDEAVAPTYTHTGLTEGSHCSVCEEVLKAQKVVPALPLYRVKDKDGRGVNYKAERKNGVLTITVDADYAILTGELRGVRALKAQGVERIEFITNSAISPFAPADLLTKGDRGETYHLTHDGETITFTLGAKKTDVSDILEGA